MSAEWQEKFEQSVRDVGDRMTYAESAERLREMIRLRLMNVRDIAEDPERFFLAHRLLAKRATELGPGFWIRFTVHWNLYTGTFNALATPEQLQQLIQRNKVSPKLGCFGLTEKFAGVNSGLVVNTQAVYDESTKEFIITTPNEGAKKRWISQGLVGDEAVVVANLTVKGKKVGPQAFFVELRNEKGQVNPGITMEDMGRKTIGNDLDNALIAFDNVRVPHSALLARYITVGDDGTVSYPSGNLRTMEMIGQRLFTGRVAVAQAALIFAQQLFKSTKGFAEKKACWSPNQKKLVLSDIPHIKEMFETGQIELTRLSKFVSKIEAELCKVLKADAIPSLQLQQAIAVAKVKAVEGAIALSFQLLQDVGSYGLMAGTGFEQMGFLQCCKFAEGDSRLLALKMGRDILRSGKTSTTAEKHALDQLKQAMMTALPECGGDKADAFSKCWKLVYALAEAHMQGILEKYDSQDRKSSSSKL